MVEKKAPAAGAQTLWLARLSASLDTAIAGLAARDSAGPAEDARAISALARAVRELSELEALLRADPAEDDVEQFRANLIARIAALRAAQRRAPPGRRDAGLGLEDAGP